MFVECIHQMCCSKWSSKMGSGWWVEFKYPIMLWIKVLWWKWSSSLSPIQPKLCGWAHLHDACVCLLSKSYSSQTKPPLHLHPAEPPGVVLQAFPRALWQLLYSNSPCLRMIPLKIYPFQNCPAHAIVHRGYGVFFFPFCTQNDLQLCHITSTNEMDGGRLEEKEPGGLKEVTWSDKAFANFYTSQTGNLRSSFYASL